MIEHWFISLDSLNRLTYSTLAEPCHALQVQASLSDRQ